MFSTFRRKSKKVTMPECWSFVVVGWEAANKNWGSGVAKMFGGSKQILGCAKNLWGRGDKKFWGSKNKWWGTGMVKIMWAEDSKFFGDSNVARMFCAGLVQLYCCRSRNWQ